MTAAVVQLRPNGTVGGEAMAEENYLTVDQLKRQYYDYLGAKNAEIEEQRQSRHYYHAAQWTDEEIRILNKRKQPVITYNRIVRKIDAIVGLVERLRQDPKGFPRTPQHDEGAELATATLRYVLDSSDWKSKSSRVARFGAIDGIAGIEYDLVEGDQGDPSLELHLVYGENFFYDPTSYDEGFTDARYCGVAKWIDVDLAKELVPEKADQIDNLMETGSDISSSNDMDREKAWINTSQKRVRLVDHWYIKNGKWLWALYIGNTVLMEGVSPFVDEKGRTFPRYRMFSATVDHDGDRYGFVRNLKSPQDEINHRRSKALHNAMSRRVVSEKGAVDDIEIARREWAKPDGWVEVNPGLKMEPDQTQKADMRGELEMLQEAKNEIENFGPNPALIGQGLEDSSGRAISLLQQAGVAELGPYLSALKNWKIRVYRDIWNIIQRHWKAERWIRVTDDQNVAQFFQINKLTLDQYGRPAMVNAIGSLDVDIIIDEAPDAINMQADNMMVLQSLGPQFAQEFPDIVLELAPLAQSVKKPMLDKIRQKQSAPPPPDPKVIALQTKAQIDAQKAQQDAALKERDAALTEQQAVRNDQRAQQQMLADMQIERLKAANQIEIERIKAEADIQIKRMEAMVNARLTQQSHEHQMQMDRERAAREPAEQGS